MMSNAQTWSYHEHGTIPPSLRPLLRAYALGYITVTGPRLLGFIRVISRRDISLPTKVNLLYTIVKTSAEPNRFPTACAITVGSATLLPRLIIAVLRRVVQQLSPKRLSLLGPKFLYRLRFITTFFSACLAFNLLNQGSQWSRKRTRSLTLRNYPNQHHIPTSPPEFAGKTIDLTLFTFTRVLDVLAIYLWTTTKPSPHHPSKTHPKLTSFLINLADPSVFSLSAAVIMHAWFYSPERLPKSYVNWINAAAQIDPGLIEVLRRARRHEFLYGVDTGQASILAPLCRQLHLPAHWADPKVTIPVPCELYHCGAGPSCEVHALRRFLTSFIFAFKLYLPLNLLSRITNPASLRRASALTSILRSSSRSSAFLAAFISMFYYAVCLARTRIGPKLIPLTVVTRQMWDSGLCVLTGCLMCGWSILVEHPLKRQELAFFVAPRALGTLLPRVYEKQYLGRERMVFAASVAAVLSLAKSERGVDMGLVRGVFGRILDGVLKE